MLQEWEWVCQHPMRAVKPRQRLIDRQTVPMDRIFHPHVSNLVQISVSAAEICPRNEICNNGHWQFISTCGTSLDPEAVTLVKVGFIDGLKKSRAGLTWFNHFQYGCRLPFCIRSEVDLDYSTAYGTPFFTYVPNFVQLRRSAIEICPVNKIHTGGCWRLSSTSGSDSDIGPPLWITIAPVYQISAKSGNTRVIAIWQIFKTAAVRHAGLFSECWSEAAFNIWQWCAL